jgi:hypothetical protein
MGIPRLDEQDNGLPYPVGNIAVNKEHETQDDGKRQDDDSADKVAGVIAAGADDNLLGIEVSLFLFQRLLNCLA